MPKASTKIIFRYGIHTSPAQTLFHLVGVVFGALLDGCDGDEIEINVPERTIHWHVSEEEITRRRAAMPPLKPVPERGYEHLYAKHVTQADLGCDFDFLAGRTPNAEPSIH